jgi:hypothetical protein
MPVRSGRRSRRFKSCHPDHINQRLTLVFRPAQGYTCLSQVRPKCARIAFATLFSLVRQDASNMRKHPTRPQIGGLAWVADSVQRAYESTGVYRPQLTGHDGLLSGSSNITIAFCARESALRKGWLNAATQVAGSLIAIDPAHSAANTIRTTLTHTKIKPIVRVTSD